uniref:Uncharacterized protein n=1 Tax=Helianthus annuus TaxID=4232 RepID=A0A251T7W8_HELAN
MVVYCVLLDVNHEDFKSGLEALLKRRQTTLTVDGRRSRGRPKMTWGERIRQDLPALHLSVDSATKVLVGKLI